IQKFPKKKNLSSINFFSFFFFFSFLFSFFWITTPQFSLFHHIPVIHSLFFKGSLKKKTKQSLLLSPPPTPFCLSSANLFFFFFSFRHFTKKHPPIFPFSSLSFFSHFFY